MAKLAAIVFSILLVSMTVVATRAQGISCGMVANSLKACLTYLRNGGAAVPPECCNGVSSLNKAANNPAERRAVCQCLKSAAQANGGLNPNYAAALPKECNVNVGASISFSTDCNQIN